MAKSFPFFGLFSFPSYFDCMLTFAFAFPSRSFVCFLWGSGGGLHKAVDVSIMQEEEHDEGGGKQRDRGPAGWLARRLGLLRGRSDWFLCNEYAGRLSNDNRFIGGWKCVPTHSYSPFSRRSRRYRSEERKKKKEKNERRHATSSWIRIFYVWSCVTASVSVFHSIRQPFCLCRPTHLLAVTRHRWVIYEPTKRLV